MGGVTQGPVPGFGSKMRAPHREGETGVGQNAVDAGLVQKCYHQVGSSGCNWIMSSMAIKWNTNCWGLTLFVFTQNFEVPREFIGSEDQFIPGKGQILSFGDVNLQGNLRHSHFPQALLPFSHLLVWSAGAKFNETARKWRESCEDN